MRIIGAIRSLVMLGICSFSVLVLPDTLLVPLLVYGSVIGSGEWEEDCRCH